MLNPHAIRAISLDLDDTLWPMVPVIARAEQGLQDWLSTHAPRTAALPLDVRQRLRRQVHADHPQMAHDLSFLRREAIRACLREAQEDPKLAEPAFDVFFALRQQVVFYPGKLEALARLAERYPLVAVSNGNADIFQTEAAPYFQAAISARALGVAKPDRRIFEAAAQAVQLPLSALLHVGDDAHTDIHGARAVGMSVAWIVPPDTAWPTEKGSAPPRFAHLRELCDHLLA